MSCMPDDRQRRPVRNVHTEGAGSPPGRSWFKEMGNLRIHSAGAAPFHFQGRDMKDMYIWVRETYRVVEPWDTLWGNCEAFDKITGECVGAWPEGGQFPKRLEDEYSLLSTA